MGITRENFPSLTTLFAILGIVILVIIETDQLILSWNLDISLFYVSDVTFKWKLICFSLFDDSFLIFRIILNNQCVIYNFFEKSKEAAHISFCAKSLQPELNNIHIFKCIHKENSSLTSSVLLQFWFVTKHKYSPYILFDLSNKSVKIQKFQYSPIKTLGTMFPEIIWVGRNI